MNQEVVEVGWSDLELVFDYFAKNGFLISNVSDDNVVLAFDRLQFSLDSKKTQLEGKKFSDAIKSRFYTTYTEISVSQLGDSWYIEFEIDGMDLCDLIEIIGDSGVITVRSRKKPHGLFYKLKIHFNQVDAFLKSLV